MTPACYLRDLVRETGGCDLIGYEAARDYCLARGILGGVAGEMGDTLLDVLNRLVSTFDATLWFRDFNVEVVVP